MTKEAAITEAVRALAGLDLEGLRAEWRRRFGVPPKLREVTGERIRDKIAASKAKGMWMGGSLPLGYDGPTDPVSRALVVNPAEADQVRRIFSLYLELGCVSALSHWLDRNGFRSKAYLSKSARQIGGKPFSRGALFYLLRNRTYLGELQHKSVSYPGAHPAIVDVELFQAVEALLAKNTTTLAPDIQRAILDGRQPPALTLERLIHGEIPLAWADQRAAFGF